MYPELDMEQLEAIIWAKLKEYRYSIRKTLMPFLLLHLGLVLQRVRLGTNGTRECCRKALI